MERLIEGSSFIFFASKFKFELVRKLFYLVKLFKYYEIQESFGTLVYSCTQKYDHRLYKFLK